MKLKLESFKVPACVGCTGIGGNCSFNFLHKLYGIFWGILLSSIQMPQNTKGSGLQGKVFDIGATGSAIFLSVGLQDPI